MTRLADGSKEEAERNKRTRSAARERVSHVAAKRRLVYSRLLPGVSAYARGTRVKQPTQKEGVPREPSPIDGIPCRLEGAKSRRDNTGGRRCCRSPIPENQCRRCSIANCVIGDNSTVAKTQPRRGRTTT